MADGTAIDLKIAAPSSILRLLELAIERALWARWAAAPSAKNELFVRDPGGYWMPDVRQLCKGRKHDWTSLQAGCLHNIICGSQWPQDRLYLAVFVDTRDCKACSGSHIGTTSQKQATRAGVPTGTSTRATEATAGPGWSVRWGLLLHQRSRGPVGGV